MTDKILLLVLDGPMQAWSYQSYFDNRNTLAYPTRSGLVGMFCAALGIDRRDASGLQQLAPLRLEVLAYRKRPSPPPAQPGGHAPAQLQDSFSPVPVRRWTDFHTVGHGYDEDTHRLFIPISAEGKTRQVLTHREYLSDACFVVLVRGPADLLARLHQALCDPRWGVWFGRKCCIPAFPICHGLFDSREEALRKRAELARSRPMEDQPFRMIREVDSFDEGSDTLLDMPVDFADRTFAPRRILEEIPPSGLPTTGSSSSEGQPPPASSTNTL